MGIPRDFLTHDFPDRTGNVLASSLRARSVIAVTVAVTLAASGGAAWAYWRLSGSGASTVAAGSALNLTLTAHPRPDEPLFPGSTSALTVLVKNDNRFAVLVTSIRGGSGPVTVDTPHRNAGCAQTGISLTASSYTVAWRIPARSTRNFLITKAIRMTNASDSACQGAAFSVPLTASGQSDAS
ncbi:hypothetical protein [Actinoplanes sp. NBRC 101535]|uniref:hypothetical protein n=1 Tax=Actinoplanes sp. NBRC 101535 TaxID=3032196 RepID=UPI0024A270A5|nr:hypothetical protein [Actinoplanes sp. NBRC 101535]GLY01015.1 hypothetical protein Acsp01_13940 [Actinoplanes sp. NBRC 101535]